MKKVIRFLIISLAPVAIIIAFAVCILLIRSSSFATDSFYMNLLTPVTAYALAGIVIVLVSKMALSKTFSTRFPFEFLAGILLVVLCNSCFIAPDLNLGQILGAISAYGFPMSSLFLGAYICLFVILLYRYFGALNAKKDTRNVQPLE